MPALFRRYISDSWLNWYVKFLLGCLQTQWGLLWSLGVLTLWATGLQAAGAQGSMGAGEHGSRGEGESGSKQPFLIAAPNNFNPNLRITPAPTASPTSPPPTASTPRKPVAVLENIETNFRNDLDNFGQQNLFLEPTAQFRLRNGDIIRFKTGYDSFAQPKFDFISNIPLQVGYERKIGNITVQGGAGVELFNRLPTALSLNAKVDVPVAPNVTLSGVVEQGPYKNNAQTLENEVTALRYGPNLYWQIDRKTSLFSLLRLGNYNDGNFEQQSFTRFEHKFGTFFLAANLFNWSYKNDAQNTGYFSPPDFLVYTGEVGWEGPIFDFLRCRVTASLGQQRLLGKFDTANNYEGRCMTKLSPNVDVDFGYAYSNVQNRQTGGSAYNNRSFTGVLRLSF